MIFFDLRALWVFSPKDPVILKYQEWPWQTKPKKGQFMNFSQGHSGTKVRYVNRACFPKEKHQNSQEWAKIHELFVLTLSLVWFAGATPENTTVILIHYGGGKKYDGSKTLRQGL